MSLLGKLILAFCLGVGVGSAALGLYVLWQERNQDFVDLADRVAALEARPSSVSASTQPDRVAGLAKRIGALESEVAALGKDVAVATHQGRHNEKTAASVGRPAALASTEGAGPHEIEILNWEWFKLPGGDVDVRGLVQNVSGTEMEYVAALVEWYDSERQFITSTTISMAISPLPPGETSPFATVADYDAEMDTARIRFTNGYGTLVPSPESITPASAPRR